MSFSRIVTSSMIPLLGLCLLAGCGGGSEEVTEPKEFTKGPEIGEEPSFGTVPMGGDIQTPNTGKR